MQLGETSQVFSAVVYFNPTYERLEGAVYIPEGQYMPDVNGFLVELLKDSRDKGLGHSPQQAQTDRQLRQPSRAIVRSEGDVRTSSSEVGAAAEETAHKNTAMSQAHNNSVSINSAGYAEMLDGAVAGGIRWADTSVGMSGMSGMSGIGSHGVSETAEAARKVENERSGDVSEWETFYAQDIRAPAAPAARAARAGLSRTQAARV
ncbi:hypothetical protein CKAH01_10734 [Colletotrichum kahawae]|uniref:Uncharacterized protein n=1 Tax=Colletotrichum kahawae TaxID=34407 RepID=A0AAD9XWS1_COLKA|nr:hypothetical protein CKAH01_10734 [Colletotrichum kahawae]